MAAETMKSLFAWVGSMLGELLPIAALGVAMFLGMVAAEKAVAMTQRKFRFSIRGLMLLTALVSVGLMIVVSVMRK
jgi:divalent metal cation (Fe/Co/Zn/Cd) transporter